jgi:hypothetical protein
VSAGPAAAAGAQTGQATGGRQPLASATLEQCVTGSEETERAVTFAGEMTAIPGSARLEMRIDVLERLPAQTAFHAVNAPGLGVWRSSAPGVKVYRYLKQVTNLAAPAYYRGAVRFRWLSSKGRLMRAVELITPKCHEPLVPAPETTLPAAGTTPAGTGATPAAA